jgi:predicted alpha/beta superfamily hydrolase
MKSKLFILSFLIITNAWCQKDNKIVIGTVDSIYSKVLNEQRKLWISLPASYGRGLNAAVRYPVIYLLDGDGHFQSIAALLKQFSTNGNSLSPEMIIVGITNTNRTRDLSPTHFTLGPDGKAMPGLRSSGGGEKFTTFIEQELIPYIESTYPVAPYRMLIGHSLGGLLVMNTFVNHREMFNAYVAIDPSMWWDNERLLKQTKMILNQQSFDGRSLFLAVANTMEEGMDTSKVKNDTSGNTLHIRSNLKLVEMLQQHKANKLNWAWKYYKDETHATVPFLAEYDAIRWAFKNYALHIPGNSPGADAFTVDYVSRHYDSVSRFMGYKILPDEQTVNSLGYQLMSEGRINKASDFFQLNIANFPTSFNVYDSMGDFYQETGNLSKAIELYTKALTIKEISDTRKKLQNLLSKQ